MLQRALDAGVPAGWVTADEVYGGSPALRGWLESRQLPYVLAVRCTEPLRSPSGTPASAARLADPEGLLGWAVSRRWCTATTLPKVSGWPWTHHGRCAPACSPGCSRTPWLTWPASTPGRHCCGPPAASRCPGARGLRTNPKINGERAGGSTRRSAAG